MSHGTINGAFVGSDGTSGEGTGGRTKMLADGRGLYLRFGPSGSKSWVYRFALEGKLHDMGLGPYPDISLAEARERATAQRKMRLDGRDPIEARNASRVAARLNAAKSMTFAECAEAYIAAHRAGWRNSKHSAQWTATLVTYVNPVFGELPVHTVDVGLVMKAIEPIWTTKPETASRVRGRIESVLDWAKARGYRHGEHPARWKGHLDHLLPARGKVAPVEHHAALPYHDLPAFMAALRQPGGLAARALEFTVLTAARTGEVIGATWPEIDFQGRLWTIPANRMKAGREHRVPLTDAALAVLGQLRRDRQRLFPVSNMAMAMVLRRMDRTELTVHGFRSTFSDWCAEQTNTPSEVREMALAHIVGDKVEAAYRRGDMFAKRRQLAEAWARYCESAKSR
jgi:integrase